GEEPDREGEDRHGQRGRVNLFEIAVQRKVDQAEDPSNHEEIGEEIGYESAQSYPHDAERPREDDAQKQIGDGFADDDSREDAQESYAIQDSRRHELRDDQH